MYGERGRCHFCQLLCPDRQALTQHLKTSHQPPKHSLCENCENFFHICAITRHREKCKARYQTDKWNFISLLFLHFYFDLYLKFYFHCRIVFYKKNLAKIRFDNCPIMSLDQFVTAVTTLSSQSNYVELCDHLNKSQEVELGFLNNPLFDIHLLGVTKKPWSTWQSDGKSWHVSA